MASHAASTPPSGDVGGRPLHRNADAQPCTCTPVARLLAGGYFRGRSGGHNALRTARSPSASSGASRAWSVAAAAGARKGMRAARRAVRPWLAYAGRRMPYDFVSTPSSRNAGGRPLRRDADAQHARGAVAPGDDCRLPGLGCHNPLRAPRRPVARSAARRPRSIAAIARARMGMRAGRRVARA